MYPEAGGSSSFARRAFNEFWSFFAAWAQMLNYVDHDRHLGVLRAALHRRPVLGRRCATSPGDIIVGALRHRRPRARSTCVGVKESAGVNIVARGHRLPHPAAAGDGRRRARLLARRARRQRRTSASAPTWKRLHPRDPDRHDRLHRHRDDLEHGRGGQGRGDDDPRRDQPRADRRVRDLLHAAGRRALRAARQQDGRQVHDPARPAGGAGRLRRRPGPGRGQAARPRPAAARRPRSTSACSPRRSSSWPPTPASSASRGSCTRWASTARCPTRLRRLHPKFRTPWIGILVFGGDREHDHAPRPGHVPGQHVLVRRDAVVHDRAPGGRSGCASPSPTSPRPYRGPGT